MNWRILSLILVLPILNSAVAGAETILQLRQAGWVVVSKTDHNEWQQGVAPYENLGSLVYVVTYTLQKDGKTRTCRLARNVMADTFEETCSIAR